MIEVKRKKVADSRGKVIMLGEPIRPSSPFYETAKQFKAVVAQLGLTGSSVTKELHASVLPGLQKLPANHLDGAKVRLLVTVEVTYEDGRVERYDAAPTGKKEKGPRVISEPVFSVTAEDGRRR